jgi:hypothetical protein
MHIAAVSAVSGASAIVCARGDAVSLPAVAADPAAPITEAYVAALSGLRRPRWQKFVVAYIACGDLAKAVVASGYGGKAPRMAGWRLERRPEIAAAIKTVREALAERSKYTLDKLVADLDDAAEFARQTSNATALVRARELKGKALGLLVDRLDARVQQVPFRIEINGIDHGGVTP